MEERAEDDHGEALDFAGGLRSMNLIELVEQARAVVRVWENGRLVDVVLVRYPVCYPEMLTCSSELPLDHGSAWYNGDAETEPLWSLSVASPTVVNRPPGSTGSVSALDHGRGGF